MHNPDPLKERVLPQPLGVLTASSCRLLRGFPRLQRASSEPAGTNHRGAEAQPLQPPQLSPAGLAGWDPWACTVVLASPRPSHGCGPQVSTQHPKLQFSICVREPSL